MQRDRSALFYLPFDPCRTPSKLEFWSMSAALQTLQRSSDGFITQLGIAADDFQHMI